MKLKYINAEIDKIKKAHLDYAKLEDLFKDEERTQATMNESYLMFWLYKAAVYSKIKDLLVQEKHVKSLQQVSTSKLKHCISNAAESANELEHYLGKYMLRNQVEVGDSLPIKRWNREEVFDVIIKQLEAAKHINDGEKRQNIIKNCLKIMLYIFFGEIDEPVNSLIFEILNNTIDV